MGRQSLLMLPADSILDPVRHARLIADLPRVAATANTPINMVHRGAKNYLGPDTLEWIKSYRRNKYNGHSLMIEGVQSVAPETQMFAIAGALLRNFIDARISSLNKLIKLADSKNEDDLPMPTVLLLPNLFVVTHGKNMTSWQIQSVYDTLLKRRIADKLTVVYVQDFEAMTNAYGQFFAQHLIENYDRV